MPPINGQHYTIEQHHTIDPHNLKQFPLKKDADNNEVTRKLIQEQFYSNMLYKKNSVEDEKIKVLTQNDIAHDRSRLPLPTRQYSLKKHTHTPNDAESDTTVSNKPKYLSKLNIYKGKKLRNVPSSESL